MSKQKQTQHLRQRPRVAAETVPDVGVYCGYATPGQELADLATGSRIQSGGDRNHGYDDDAEKLPAHCNDGAARVDAMSLVGVVNTVVVLAQLGQIREHGTLVCQERGARYGRGAR